MGIASGATRVVLLIGTVAVKLPRFTPPFHAARRLRQCLADGTVREKLAYYDQRSLWHAAIKYLALGIAANRDECRFYRAHPELPLAPIYAQLLWGLVLVQARGVPAPEHERRRWRPLQLAEQGATVHIDLVKPEHLCMCGNRLCLVDYAHADSQTDLLAAFA